jgi:DNA adenine methylase
MGPRYRAAMSKVEADARVEAQPFLKWAGGKGAIAAQIEKLLPRDARGRMYREPFLGGGAMYFHLQPERAALSDVLTDLVTAYQVVQTHVDALITRLVALRETHSEAQYYAIRERYNAEKDADRIERAAWLVYLNKTCFNGLYRTNSKGVFNVPVGRYTNPQIVDPTKMRVASAVLGRAEIKAAPFQHLLEVAEPGDLIYFDPPYVPTSRSSSFSGYHEGVFTIDDQIRLAEVFEKLDERGCLLALSNSDTDATRDLYKRFDVHRILAPRAISSKASTRGEVHEVLVRNVARY